MVELTKCVHVALLALLALLRSIFHTIEILYILHPPHNRVGFGSVADAIITKRYSRYMH